MMKSFGGKRFVEVWASEIYPAIKDDYEAMLHQYPARSLEKAGDRKQKKQEKDKEKKEEEKKPKKQKKEEKKEQKDPAASATDKQDSAASATPEEQKDQFDSLMTSVIHTVRERSERRNAYDKVANMFCDVSRVVKDAAQKTASVEDSEAAPQQQSSAQASISELVAREDKLLWQIPSVVEKGYEIPICITNTFAVPELGHFKRLGMDIVVNAAWLAYYWAKTEGNDAAASALKNLMLDWPMDFVLISGDTPEDIEENMFKWAVNMSAKKEEKKVDKKEGKPKKTKKAKKTKRTPKKDAKVTPKNKAIQSG